MSSETGCHKRVGWLAEREMESAGLVVRRKDQAMLQRTGKVLYGAKQGWLVLQRKGCREGVCVVWVQRKDQ